MNLHVTGFHLTSASFVLTRIALILFFSVACMRSAMQTKFSPLTKRFSAVVNTAHKRLSLGVGMLVLLKVLL